MCQLCEEKIKYSPRAKTLTVKIRQTIAETLAKLKTERNTEALIQLHIILVDCYTALAIVRVDHDDTHFKEPV